ncbi:MAG: hypothetical protein DRP89_08585 [Candidatus Neomarinimicrobiota bacterium]|nr:MAG: hypothetical protein DRP89_08585 [Candidatus Neomarinimicrobiota bacterium]
MTSGNLLENTKFPKMINTLKNDFCEALVIERAYNCGKTPKRKKIGEKMIRVERGNGGIIVKFSYNPDYIIKIKPSRGINGIPKRNIGAFLILNLRSFYQYLTEKS